MPNMFAMDLGTQNLRVYNKHTNSIIREKNTLAVLNRKLLYAYGDDAYDMAEKAPSNIDVIFPVSGGVISEFNHMQAMMMELLGEKSKGHIRGSEIVLSVPNGVTEVQKKAFFDLFYKSKLKTKAVYLCDKPIADAIGMGLDVTEPTGRFIVNMGADTTEVSIVSLGGVVIGELLPYGGNHMDEAIVSFIRRAFNLVIGKKTATMLKERLGSALPDEEGRMTIIGVDVVSGLPVEMSIDAALIYDAIHDGLESMCRTIRKILEKTPPELAKDIILSGIYLTGAASKIKNMSKLLTELTNMSINTFIEPEDTVVKGLSEVLLNPKYQHLVYSMKTKLFR